MKFKRNHQYWEYQFGMDWKHLRNWMNQHWKNYLFINRLKNKSKCQSGNN